MARLQIARRDVVAMEGRMSGMDISLNVPTSADDASEKIDALADNSETPDMAYQNISEQGYQRRLLGQALECVSVRDAEIFKARRFGEDAPTLKELGTNFGLSPERVRQIEHGVFKVVRDYVLTEAPEYGSQFG